MDPGERIATLEEQIRGMREDLAQLTTEVNRARRRLHDAESTIGGMVALNNESRQTHNDQQRRIELRIQVLTAVIAVAALAEPFLYAAVHP